MTPKRTCYDSDGWFVHFLEVRHLAEPGFAARLLEGAYDGWKELERNGLTNIYLKFRCMLY
jgi:hypothetical protein